MLDEIEIGCATTNTKYKERLDCAVVKIPKSSTLSGVFTTNNFKSAPVKDCLKKFKKKLNGNKLLVINAGNANAGTGLAGEKDLELLLNSLSSMTGVEIKNILPFSTGVIGERLKIKSLTSAFEECSKSLKKNNFNNSVSYTHLTLPTILRV